MTASALYHGTVAHRRLTGAENSFSYPVFMAYIDLDELPEVVDRLPGWSTSGRSWVQFRNSDYFDGSGRPLAEPVRDLVEQRTGSRPEGPVRLLANPRIAGYIFNPLAVYYCFEPDRRTLAAAVLEVTNMPWRERTWYVLEAGSFDGGRFGKEMHVSPFLPMDMEYRVSLEPPGRELALRLLVSGEDGPALDTSLALERLPLSARSAVEALLRNPLMTMRVTASIHWQALRLWLRRVPFIAHPAKAGGERQAQA